MKTQGEENHLEVKERDLRMKPILLTRRPQASSLWNYEKIHFCGLSCSAGVPGTSELVPSLTPRLPAYPTYRVCELVGNELAHQGNGCGPFLPNLEE